MTVIHVGDAAKRLLFQTGRQLEEAESWSILFEKPDGTTGEIETGLTLHESGRSIVWPISGADFFDQAGVWKFQARVVFDGLPAIGQKAALKVHTSIAS